MSTFFFPDGLSLGLRNRFCDLTTAGLLPKMNCIDPIMWQRLFLCFKFLHLSVVFVISGDSYV